MKIILLGPAHPYRGGLATFNERLVRELLARKHDATLYTFTLQYPGFLFPGKSQFMDTPPPGDLSIKRRIHTVNPLNWVSTGNEIRKIRPDLVLIRYWLPFMAPALGTIARKARRNGHTKVLAIMDNVIPHEKRAGDKALTRYFLHSCDAFLTMSSYVLSDLRKFNVTKPAVQVRHPLYDNFGAPLSRDKALDELHLDPAYRYLLFFGFIRHYKGLDLLLQAMADPRVAGRPLRLIVAGEYYEDPKPYEELMHSLQLKQRVVLHTRFIPDADVKTYFCAADVVVQPYRQATQSGVTQVAWHFDKPVIVTAVGGMPELVLHDRTGLCIAPEPAAIAAALDRYFEESLGDRFIPEIREYKKQFSWPVLAEEIEKLYASIQVKID